VDTASGRIGTDGSTATTGDGDTSGGLGGEFSGGGKRKAVESGEEWSSVYEMGPVGVTRTLVSSRKISFRIHSKNFFFYI